MKNEMNRLNSKKLAVMVWSGLVSICLAAMLCSLPVLASPPGQAPEMTQAIKTASTALGFSSYFGGNQTEAILAADVDASGNLVIAGWTESMDLASLARIYGEFSGTRDGFVAKISPDGQSVLFVTYLGGSGSDEISSVRVAEDGSIFVSGSTSSSDFPTVKPVQEEFGGGSADAFLARLSSSGSQWLFATYLGGDRTDTGSYVDVDSSGKVYFAGGTNSTDWLPKGGFQEEFAGGNTDVFVLRLNSSLSTIEAATYLGGTRADRVVQLLTDPDAGIVLLGQTDSTDYPLVEPIQEARQGPSDVVISRLNPDLTDLLKSTYFGGRGAEIAYDAAVDSRGAVLIAGDTSSPDFLVTHPIQPVYAGGTDAFVARISPELDRIERSTLLGGSSFDSARSLVLREDGLLVISGVTGSVDFPLEGAITKKKEGTDLFQSVVDIERSELLFSSYFGAEKTEIVTGGALLGPSLVGVVGATDSLEFPTGDVFQPEFAGKGIFQSNSSAQSWAPTGRGLTDPNVGVIAVGSGNPGRVFAGTSSSGVFLSENRGDTWNSIGPEGTGVISIAPHPEDGDVVYIGTQAAVQKTTDGGDTWQPVMEGLPQSGFICLTVDPSDPETVYTGTLGRGIFKTTNGGERWRAINGNLDDLGKRVYQIVADTKDSSTVYIGTEGAVYKTTNGGVNWEKTSFQNVGPVRGLARNSTTSVIYATGITAIGPVVGSTTDGGTIWNAQPVEGSIIGLVADPFNTNTVYLATVDRGILKSTDGGTTFNEVNQDLPVRRVTSLAISPRSSSALYTGTLSGFDGFATTFSHENVFYFPQVGAGGVARVRFRTGLILVNMGAETVATVEFYDSSGEPMPLSLGGDELAKHEITLGTGESAFLQTPENPPDFKVGYARVLAGPGVDGSAVFSESDFFAGQVVYEAGVPATRALDQFSFVLDSLEEKNTGLALVCPLENLENGPAAIELILYDKDLNVIDVAQLVLEPGHHVARYISELFPEVADLAAEMQGFIRVDSDRPIVAISLRRRDDPRFLYPKEVPTLTPSPVLTQNNLGNVIYFPQVGNGEFGEEQFRTTFQLANAGSGFSVVTLEFFDAAGEPMALDLGAGVEETLRRVNLSPNQFVFLETTGLGTPKVGYARATSNSLSVSGTAIFGQEDSPRDLILFETAVPATLTAQEFSIFVESREKYLTGLAMVNTGEEDAKVELKLLDAKGELLAEGGVVLKPGQHMARFVFQLFPDAGDVVNDMQGLMTVKSDQPLAGTTLRQKNDPDIIFPVEVPTLTTLPIIPGVIEK